MKCYNRILYVIFVLLLLFPEIAYAYIDPGTGSLLLSITVSIFATALFFIRGLVYKVKAIFYRFRGKKYYQKTQGFVFYADGGQYWTVFEPILAALSARGEACTYLTSDATDAGLQYTAPHIKCHYIGKGNQAYVQLNTLEADVCVMTTPGLDVYQLRRSSGVKHYAHVVHAPGEISLYRRFGLDYYDSVFTSGMHQERSIRYLESQRNITPKTIFHSGCPYYDVLLKKKHNLAAQSSTQNSGQTSGLHILIAPTWGANGLLTRYGMQLLTPLMEAGYAITIRPHPQSYVVEQKLLQSLQEQTKTYAHVSWDDSKDNFLALSKAHVLISDYSSIIFDFAFVFERPVLTLDFEPDLRPYDAHCIPEKPWEFTTQHKIGMPITLEDIPKLPEIVQKFANDKDFVLQLQTFRDANVYNFGMCAQVIVDQLVSIKESLQEKP